MKIFLKLSICLFIFSVIAMGKNMPPQAVFHVHIQVLEYDSEKLQAKIKILELAGMVRPGITMKESECTYSVGDVYKVAYKKPKDFKIARGIVLNAYIEKIGEGPGINYEIRRLKFLTKNTVLYGVKKTLGTL